MKELKKRKELSLLSLSVQVTITKHLRLGVGEHM